MLQLRREADLSEKPLAAEDGRKVGAEHLERDGWYADEERFAGMGAKRVHPCTPDAVDSSARAHHVTFVCFDRGERGLPVRQGAQADGELRISPSLARASDSETRQGAPCIEVGEPGLPT